MKKLLSSKEVCSEYQISYDELKRNRGKMVGAVQFNARWKYDKIAIDEHIATTGKFYKEDAAIATPFTFRRRGCYLSAGRGAKKGDV